MFKGWRTIIFNVIMLGFMIASQTGMIGADQVPTGEAVSGWLDNLDLVLSGIWGVGNLGLRMITDTSVGKSE